jgi:hypothetical protein
VEGPLAQKVMLVLLAPEDLVVRLVQLVTLVTKVVLEMRVIMVQLVREVQQVMRGQQVTPVTQAIRAVAEVVAVALVGRIIFKRHQTKTMLLHTIRGGFLSQTGVPLVVI